MSDSENSVIPLNPAPVPTTARTTAIIPRNLDEIKRIAQGVKASGLAPRGMDTEAQITVAIMHGLEIGLPPMQAIQKIAVINGRPSIWGDAVPALLYANGFKISEKELIRGNTVGEVNGYECTVTRPDGETITRKFTESDAKTAKLWGKAGPWQQYPKRMLQMRARALAARDGAADILSGMYFAEEARDIEPEAPAVDLTDTAEDAPEQAIWLNHTVWLERPDRPSVYAYKKDGGGETMKEVQAILSDAECRQDILRQLVNYSDEINAMPASWVTMLKDYIASVWDDLPDEAPTDEGAEG
jgi:hypothetical protein